MRKHNTVKQSTVVRKKSNRKLTMAIDLGDRSSCYCILDEQGEVLAEGSVATTKKGFAQVFGAKPRSRVALEVGTHSPWVSRYLAELGHEVIVANARRVRLITDSDALKWTLCRDAEVGELIDDYHWLYKQSGNHDLKLPALVALYTFDVEVELISILVRIPTL